MLPQALLSLCTLYLEPMGLVDLFMRGMLITSLLENNGTLQQPRAAGGIGSDHARMVGRMLKRNWCPSVAKEHADLFLGGKPGITTVVEADNTGYDVPYIYVYMYMNIYIYII